MLLFFPDGIAPRYLMDAADAFWRYLNNLVENVDGSPVAQRPTPDRLCFEAVNSYFCECFVRRGSTGKFRENSQKREQLAPTAQKRAIGAMRCNATQAQCLWPSLSWVTILEGFVISRKLV